MASDARSQPLMLVMGASRGVVGRLTPRTRIIAGLMVFLSCLVPDASTVPGLLALTLTVVTWFAAAGAPPRLVGKLSVLGLVMLSPIFVFTPFVDVQGGPGPQLWVTLAVFARGMATLLVATVTLSTLTLSEAHHGLSTLPLPRLLTAIVVQILMQASLLGREASHLVRAMRVRRTTEGYANGLLTLAGVSRTWMQRLLLKVDRVASAMELRGFDGVQMPLPVAPTRRRDATALALACSWIFLTLAARCWGIA